MLGYVIGYIVECTITIVSIANSIYNIIAKLYPLLSFIGYVVFVVLFITAFLLIILPMTEYGEKVSYKYNLNTLYLMILGWCLVIFVLMPAGFAMSQKAAKDKIVIDNSGDSIIQINSITAEPISGSKNVRGTINYIYSTDKGVYKVERANFTDSSWDKIGNMSDFDKIVALLSEAKDTQNKCVVNYYTNNNIKYITKVNNCYKK